MRTHVELAHGALEPPAQLRDLAAVPVVREQEAPERLALLLHHPLLDFFHRPADRIVRASARSVSYANQVRAGVEKDRHVRVGRTYRRSLFRPSSAIPCRSSASLEPDPDLEAPFCSWRYTDVVSSAASRASERQCLRVRFALWGM